MVSDILRMPPPIPTIQEPEGEEQIDEEDEEGEGEEDDEQKNKGCCGKCADRILSWSLQLWK